MAPTPAIAQHQMAEAAPPAVRGYENVVHPDIAVHNPKFMEVNQAIGYFAKL